MGLGSRSFCALCFLVTVATERRCGPGETECPGGVCVPHEAACEIPEPYRNADDGSGCSGSAGCDFEAGLCSMSHGADAPATWNQSSGLNDVGPAYDHKGQRTGHFLFLSRQSGVRPRADLRSAVFLPTSACQVTFYHYFGRVDGVLRVLTQIPGSSPPHQVWLRSESLVEPRTDPSKVPWQRTVLLLSSDSSFQVILQGELYDSCPLTEIVAIDDVSFSEDCILAMADSGSPCREGFPTCVPHSASCGFTRGRSPSPDGDRGGFQEGCGFESGLCGWQTEGPALWRRVSGQGAVRSASAPTVDHSQGSAHGHYLRISGNPVVIPKVALLASPRYRAPGSACTLHFHHALWDGAELTVWLQTSEENQTVFHNRRGTDDLWMGVNVSLGIHQDEFQVVFEGRVTAESGSVSLDSVWLSACESVGNGEGTGSPPLLPPPPSPPPPLPPPSSPPPTACPPRSFRCHSGDCISDRFVCDFTAHCPGGEDEAKCPSSCDFEYDSCGWFEFAQGDGFDWVRSTAAAVPPPFQGLAPPRDHTTNSTEGGFMFLLKNSSCLSQKALLRGPKYSQAASGCTVTFWHYNAGRSVGAADMYLRIDGMDNITVVWRTLYDQGREWHPVTVQLGRLTHPFQFSLAKVSLAVYEGISALDDIVFHNCSLPPPVVHCPSNRFHCARSLACIDHLLLCDLIDDCGDGSDEEGCSPDLQCSFENGLCSWTQMTEEDVFDWTRIQGPTPTPNTGPWKDHTLGHVNGHYLFIEASSPQEFMDTAVLVSRIFQASSTGVRPCIFRFSYHMYGQHVFRLAVYLRTVASGRGQQLWARFGDLGNLWHQEALTLISTQPFQILVEGTVGDDFTGDIAIDDLSFLDCIPHDGDLPMPGSTTPPGITISPTGTGGTCADGQLVCGSTGECISLAHRCDFHRDCDDGTDEQDCVAETCDFEPGGRCGWYQDVADVSPHIFRWIHGQGRSIHYGEETHRPAKDHTHGTSDGWYMYADSSNGGFSHTADLLTPPIIGTGPRCTLVFWYHMSGFTVGTLQVLGKFGNVTHELWSESGSQGYRWRRGEVFLGIQRDFQVVLRAKRGISYMGDVVVDDVSFQDCAPPRAPDRPCRKDEFACANGYCIPADHLCDFISDCQDASDEDPHICRGFSGRCNFEFDLCSWRQCREDDFDWLTKVGGSLVGGTGPPTDHTLRDPSGHYIYLRSSFPQAEKDIARILSPTFSSRSQQCKVIFYLYMSGEGVGSLSVLLASSFHSWMLLNLTGDQGSYWQRCEVDLGTITTYSDFRLVFEGTVGPGSNGDICLDDISFTQGCLLTSSVDHPGATPPPTSGSCPWGHLPCGNGGCYQPEQSCDFADDCGDSTDEAACGTSCSFESSLCGWKNSHADNFDWTRGAGSVQSLRPTVDHTLGSEHGHFVYLEASPVGLKGDKAHMRSSVWKESSATCRLIFWYYLSPKATGVIRLLVRMDNMLTEVWNMTGNQGERWNRAEVPLSKMRNFELIFEGIRAIDVSGGAALDDLEFSDCAPSPALPASCPAATDFICQNGDCIESHLACDLKADCADESDEQDCSHILSLPGACNFNLPDAQSWEDECHLIQSPDDEFDWKLGHTRETMGTGPAGDHSPDGQGRFLYISSAVQREGDVATVMTKAPFPASTGVCHLRFWYYMYGSRRMGALKVYAFGESGTDLLMWAAAGNQGDRWKYASVMLSSPTPFRVAFRAEVGGDMWTDIALDDISFTAPCYEGAPMTAEPSACGSHLFQCQSVFQCIPRSWLCDGEQDCADRSDEEGCPPRVPGTVPPQELCGPGQFQCADGGCIPSLLRCDWVPDCRHGEDEFSCPLRRCPADSLLCEDTADCLPPWRLCDGTPDCPAFQPDESSCHICPLEYCMNGGTCHLELTGPTCRCSPKWTGRRCHLREKHPLPTSPSVPVVTGPDAMRGVLGAGLMLLVGGVTAIILVLLQIKYQCFTGRGPSEMQSRLVEKTTADLSDHKLPTTDRILVSVYPWLSDAEVSHSLSFPNPLYQRPGSGGKLCDCSSEA
ncbi:MAM and LDL-receptor class A domain-containing protein 1 isoform X1 [Paramormyrops kingsleyae]|uniref:MAM and LDL-receptor class A domain-containing protein 1 isoform X1 n=1 Tax=Paramormyrops kingsleyae TaxID=1676925 RepID=UPI003B970230